MIIEAIDPKYAPSERGPLPDLQTQVWIYRNMVAVRRFEEQWHRNFLQGLTGPGHSSIGMEGISAAVGALLRPDDYSFATYRGHAHTIARGVPLRPIMAELLGKATGLSHGKGGSMHLTSVEHGMMGSYAIIGAHLPIAMGAALSAKYRGTDQVSVCFFGDGTTNIGAFHEALNMAKIWDLPVVFVCENNLYMEYTSIASITAVKHPAADRAASYSLPGIVIDGNNPDEVYSTIGAAIANARAGKGPALIEAMTYRHGGHASADAGTYRPEEEIAAWKERDPIPYYRNVLIAAGMDAAAIDAIDAEVLAEVNDASTFAQESPEPDASTLETQVWADGGSTWRN